MIHFHGCAFFQQPVRLTAQPGTVSLLTSVRAANDFNSSISSITSHVCLLFQTMTGFPPLLWAPLSVLIQRHPQSATCSLSVNRTGNTAAHPSAIASLISHLFLVILFLLCPSFWLSPVFWSLVPDGGGGSEYFQGTTAYQRHSRERGGVTSVSWRHKVYSVSSEKVERLLFSTATHRN